MWYTLSEYGNLILRVKNMVKEDILSKEKIFEKLNNKNTEITLLESVDSTNRFLKRNSDNAKEWTTVIAENQTSGRGRYDRKFYSPENCGIYMSILLKPEISADSAVLITAAAAVAVAEAVETLSGKETQIKWVNDVLINSKKVCGILCEGVINLQTGCIDRVVLGIGINVYTPENDFDYSIKDIAAAVFEEKIPDMRNSLVAEVINRFEGYYAQLESRSFLEGYRKRSIVAGKNITVLNGRENFTAKVVEIDENCQLDVVLSDGTEKKLSSGEISIRFN